MRVSASVFASQYGFDMGTGININRQKYRVILFIKPTLLFFYYFSVLSLLSFFLPSEAGERITLVITNMLALTVFMLIVADILPQTSEVVPLISVYFTSILIEVRY